MQPPQQIGDMDKKNSKNINNNNKKLNTWQMSLKKKSNTWQTNKCQINATCSAKWSADIWGTTRGLGRAGAIKVVQTYIQKYMISRSNSCFWKCFILFFIHRICYTLKKIIFCGIESGFVRL